MKEADYENCIPPGGKRSVGDMMSGTAAQELGHPIERAAEILRAEAALLAAK